MCLQEFLAASTLFPDKPGAALEINRADVSLCSLGNSSFICFCFAYLSALASLLARPAAREQVGPSRHGKGTARTDFRSRTWSRKTGTCRRLLLRGSQRWSRSAACVPAGIKPSSLAAFWQRSPRSRNSAAESKPLISTHETSVVVEAQFDGGVKRGEFINASIRWSCLSHAAATAVQVRFRQPQVLLFT